VKPPYWRVEWRHVSKPIEGIVYMQDPTSIDEAIRVSRDFVDPDVDGDCMIVEACFVPGSTQ